MALFSDSIAAILFGRALACERFDGRLQLAPPSPADDDPTADDPFFRLLEDLDWNACIGRQGDEENYIEGYMDAAGELAEAVIEKKMYEKREHARAAHLVQCSPCRRAGTEIRDRSPVRRRRRGNSLGHAGSHDILAHWQLLSDARPCGRI